MGELISNWRSY